MDYSLRPIYRKLALEPTQEEIEEHNLNHASFRSWCPHCVKGQAKSFPHKRVISRYHEVPVISIDYAFMSDDKDKRDDSEKGMPIIVLVDKEPNIRGARVVPKKGVDTYAVDRIKKDLGQLGHRKIISKSDQENSSKALKQAVR